MCSASKKVATVADAGGRSPDGGVESLPTITPCPCSRPAASNRSTVALTRADVT
jgi:hypothetical protein